MKCQPEIPDKIPAENAGQILTGNTGRNVNRRLFKYTQRIRPRRFEHGTQNSCITKRRKIL